MASHDENAAPVDREPGESPRTRVLLAEPSSPGAGQLADQALTHAGKADPEAMVIALGVRTQVPQSHPATVRVSESPDLFPR